MYTNGQMEICLFCAANYEFQIKADADHKCSEKQAGFPGKRENNHAAFLIGIETVICFYFTLFFIFTTPTPPSLITIKL